MKRMRIKKRSTETRKLSQRNAQRHAKTTIRESRNGRSTVREEKVREAIRPYEDDLRELADT